MPTPAAPWSCPNSVCLICDDGRAADSGCCGNRGARPPRMDALAARGLRFAHADVTAPGRRPSRGGLLTSRYPPKVETAVEFAGRHRPEDVSEPPSLCDTPETRRAAHAADSLTTEQAGNLAARPEAREALARTRGLWDQGNRETGDTVPARPTPPDTDLATGEKYGPAQPGEPPGAAAGARRIKVSERIRVSRVETRTVHL